MPHWTRRHRAAQGVIGGMGASPESEDLPRVCHSECPVVEADPDGADAADRCAVPGRIAWGLAPAGAARVCPPLYGCWHVVSTAPATGRRVGRHTAVQRPARLRSAAACGSSCPLAPSAAPGPSHPVASYAAPQARHATKSSGERWRITSATSRTVRLGNGWPPVCGAHSPPPLLGMLVVLFLTPQASNGQN
jgi:hypothetical protein